jgi:Domain of Unknown Function (DUF1080)
MKHIRYRHITHQTFLLLIFLCNIQLYAQQTTKYNLAQLLKENKFLIAANRQPQALTGEEDNAIATHGIIWLKDAGFSEGTIDIDLRGKDIFLQSFLGIAFHAADTSNYEVVYFRPFNFRHADTLRRKWSVQYMVLPEYDYTVLRAQHPLVYENSVTPVPKADEWFHVTIVVKGDQVTVYVNHSKEASLRVTKLMNMNTGMIGLWDSGITGDFANLTITR